MQSSDGFTSFLWRTTRSVRCPDVPTAQPRAEPGPVADSGPADRVCGRAEYDERSRDVVAVANAGDDELPAQLRRSVETTRHKAYKGHTEWDWPASRGGSILARPRHVRLFRSDRKCVHGFGFPLRVLARVLHRGQQRGGLCVRSGFTNASHVHRGRRARQTLQIRFHHMEYGLDWDRSYQSHGRLQWSAMGMGFYSHVGRRFDRRYSLL